MKATTYDRLAVVRIPILFGGLALGLLYLFGFITWSPIHLILSQADYPAWWVQRVVGAITWAYLGAQTADIIDYVLQAATITRE